MRLPIAFFVADLWREPGGQVYVLISRARVLVHARITAALFLDRENVASQLAKVTDPRNMLLVGVPPKDLIEDVAQALIRAGLDPDACFARSCDVTQELAKRQTLFDYFFSSRSL